MKKLLWILTGLSVLLALATALISNSIFDSRESERNARQTAPAREAKLAKKQAQETVTQTTDEKQEQAV